MTDGIVFTANEEHIGVCPICRLLIFPGQRLIYTSTDSPLAHLACVDGVS